MGKNGNGKKIAAGAAIGAAVGVVAGFVTGILTAPKSGKETRKDIKDTANKVTREAEKKLKELYADLGDVIDKGKALARKEGAKAKAEFLSALSKAEKAQQKAKEVITAIRDGEADQPELDKAVKEATAAKDHLKQYLQKS